MSSADGVRMEAWAPFAEGRSGLFANPVLEEIGKRHGKTVAQVVLRWHHQRGVVTIPRSSNPEHRRENLAIFDFLVDRGRHEQDQRYGILASR